MVVLEVVSLSSCRVLVAGGEVNDHGVIFKAFYFYFYVMLLDISNI